MRRAIYYVPSKPAGIATGVAVAAANEDKGRGAGTGATLTGGFNGNAMGERLTNHTMW